MEFAMTYEQAETVAKMILNMAGGGYREAVRLFTDARNRARADVENWTPVRAANWILVREAMFDLAGS